MSIVISDTILKASRLTSNELLREITLHLFQIGSLTLGYASQLAEMDTSAITNLAAIQHIQLLPRRKCKMLYVTDTGKVAIFT